MRELTLHEAKIVSGSSNNMISEQTLIIFHHDAQHQAAVEGLGLGAFAGVASYCLLGGLGLVSAPAAAAVVVATVTASVAYQYSYQNYQHWPWNQA